MLHQIDRKVILGLADLIHIHNPFLMQFVFSSGVALLILAPALVPGSNAILFLRHPAVLDTVDITSVAKDRKAPSGGKSRTREADDAAIFA